jgi:tRNA pseudouridine55 synthase
VTVHVLDLVRADGREIEIRVDCSAGFYVRALAHELGERLGTGAHLLALRRTRSGDLTLADAIALDAVEHDAALAAHALVPLSRMLPGLPAMTLGAEGVRRAVHGQDLRPQDATTGSAVVPGPQGPGLPHRDLYVRLLDPEGQLVGMAEPSRTPGVLHPLVVLV